MYIAVILYKVGLKSLTNVRQLFATSNISLIRARPRSVGW